MPRWIYRPDHPDSNENGLVEIDRVYESGNAPYVIRDEMDATRHMATGEFFTSKHKFREATRRSGCIELGDDRSLTEPKTRTVPKMDRRKRREDIRRTIYDLRNGRG